MKNINQISFEKLLVEDIVKILSESANVPCDIEFCSLLKQLKGVFNIHLVNYRDKYIRQSIFGIYAVEGNKERISLIKCFQENIKVN